jgi:hypothetical protein
LDLCWPTLTFDEKLRRVWMTESVLCSAPVESGRVRREIEIECGERYLKRQLDLFPNALVVALGAKAQRRLLAIGFSRFLAASAVAPPEGNRPRARVSWDAIPVELEKLRRGSGLKSDTAPRSDTHNPHPPICAANRTHKSEATIAVNHQLVGRYRVVDSSRLQATEESDPGKWSVWREIWRCQSFEELAEACPFAAVTRTNRRITWRSEARWALQRGWIEKV